MKRKPNNPRARLERAMGGLLRTHHAAVVDATGPEIQLMFNWKNGRQIISKPVADALCDFPQRWTIYLSVLCKQPGEHYTKTVELKPQGIYIVTDLDELIETQTAELLATCNPQHVIATAWVAIPNDVSLNETQLNFIYTRVDAWHTQAAA